MMDTQERIEDGASKNAVKDALVLLRVKSLLEVEAFKKRCSDRLLNLPAIYEDTGDLYNVCDVLPQDPTDEQFADLAFRFSNFLEDVRRYHVDRRHYVIDEIGALSCAMSIPLVHRAKLREVEQRAPERETMCVLYLNVPRWTKPVRVIRDRVVERRVLARYEQIVHLDELARRHGLRCVEIGVIPEL